jgi:hypothetical protein
MLRTLLFTALLYCWALLPAFIATWARPGRTVYPPVWYAIYLLTMPFVCGLPRAVTAAFLFTVASLTGVALLLFCC